MRDQYRLIARKGSASSVVPLYADDDTDATFAAIAEILNRASHDKNGVWATGSITLLDPQGVTLHEMPAK